MKKATVVFLVLAMFSATDYGNTKQPEASAPKDETAYLQLMPMLKWEDLSEGQKELYVKGFLETFSFFVYGMSKRDQESAQYFSDWTACTMGEPAKRWIGVMSDWLFGDLKATAASQLWKTSGIVCQKYRGKGNKQWKPVQLVSSDEWTNLSPENKEIYATSYIETEDVANHKAKQDATIEHLESCMKNGGEKRFLDAVKTIPVERQNPLPWSISKALGIACW